MPEISPVTGPPFRGHRRIGEASARLDRRNTERELDRLIDAQAAPGPCRANASFPSNSLA